MRRSQDAQKCHKQTAASGSAAIHDFSMVYHHTTGYKAVQTFSSPQTNLLFPREAGTTFFFITTQSKTINHFQEYSITLAFGTHQGKPVSAPGHCGEMLWVHAQGAPKSGSHKIWCQRKIWIKLESIDAHLKSNTEGYINSHVIA